MKLVTKQARETTRKKLDRKKEQKNKREKRCIWRTSRRLKEKEAIHEAGKQNQKRKGNIARI